MNQIRQNKTIKFGIMCESPILKAWEVGCIEQIFSIENVKLALLIHPGRKVESKKRILKKKLSLLGGKLKHSFNLYEKLLPKPKCYSRMDLSDKFKDIPYIYCTTEKKNSSEYFTRKDIERIKETTIDFIILFSGFKRIEGEILNSCRHGIWEYHHGDIKKNSETLVGFWEIYNNDKVIKTSLLKLTSKAAEGIVLRKGFFKVLNYSYSKTLDSVYAESSKLLKEVCQELINNIAENFDNSPVEKYASVCSKPNYFNIIKLYLILIKNKITKFLNNLFIIEQWNIGFIKKSIHELLEQEEELKIDWFPLLSRNRSLSDPFVIKFNKASHILFEYFDYNENKGRISGFKIANKDEIKEIKTLMKKPCHLSYPFVFEHDDEIYMIPEQWRTNEIALYKAKNFPLNWEKMTVMLKNVSAVDTTLFKYNGLWWIFFTQKKENPDLRLFVYYANDFFGPWKPHKKNPVKTDIRSSHPAGSVFEYENSLIRPSQDCSKTYGGRIVLNKIIKLTPQEFEEETFKFFAPPSQDIYNKGIHTINAIDNLIVIDGKRNIFYPKKIGQIIRKKFPFFPLKKKIHPKYRFLTIPRFVERNHYDYTIKKIVDRLKFQRGVRAIYQFGNINHPGISDIDLLVVFDNETSNEFDLKQVLKGADNYLLTHKIVAISKYHFNQINKYSMWHNLTHLSGEKFELEKVKLSESEDRVLKRQTAMEFLIDNYINLTVQLKYGAILLRSVIQHIKAIKYDLEFLNISSGNLYEMVNQLLGWIEDWFENPTEYQLFCEWIDLFYFELEKFLNIHLKKDKFYIPAWSNLKISRNIRIECGNSVSYTYSGFFLPKFFIGLNKRNFNLNTRFNKFIFKIPFSNIPCDKILETRINYYKEIKEYNLKYNQNYAPSIPGFASKIL